jgi:hypothetical protein
MSDLEHLSAAQITARETAVNNKNQSVADFFAQLTRFLKVVLPWAEAELKKRREA